jgi:hypothetical protein
MSNSGQFKPGESGNPCGKPKGAVSEKTRLLREATPDILLRVIAQAKAGDVRSQELILSRTVPPLKAQHGPSPFELRGETLTERGEAVLAAVAAGELDPLIGKALLDSLASLVRVAELDEIRNRLDNLENRRNGR